MRPFRGFPRFKITSKLLRCLAATPQYVVTQNNVLVETSASFQGLSGIARTVEELQMSVVVEAGWKRFALAAISPLRMDSQVLQVSDGRCPSKAKQRSIERVTRVGFESSTVWSSTM